MEKKNDRIIIPLLLFVFLCAFTGMAQEVLRYPDGVYIADGVYTKGSGRRSIDRTINLSWQQIYAPVYVYDTAALKNAESRIAHFRKNYPSAPISLNECVYVTPAANDHFDLLSLIIPPSEKKLPGSLPHSFLFYSDTLSYRDSLDPASRYYMTLKLKRPIEDFYEPFYFKKTEVTNKEYREFVHWVTDSIARRLLAEGGYDQYLLAGADPAIELLNKKEKIDWKDSAVLKILAPLFLPDDQRYYRRMELDARRLAYKYSYGNITEVINVYPDTLTWANDFSGSAFEPKVNMYFWHRAYDNYPVVGITQLQAKAFLIWKTKQQQEELNRRHSPYIISYELPDELQWEMMAAKASTEFYKTAYMPFTDKSFETSLLVKEDTSGAAYETVNKNFGDSKTTSYRIDFPGNSNPRAPQFRNTRWQEPTPFYLFNCSWQYTTMPPHVKTARKIYEDENGISFMGGNVSEWMKDTYQDNWKAVYTMHHNKLKLINTPYAKLLAEQEALYDSMNDTSGVLVRGANWYDLSFTSTGSKNFEGMNKKRFADPQNAYATVGFRYVVKVYRKSGE